jgi:hypothetical protein
MKCSVTRTLPGKAVIMFVEQCLLSEYENYSLINLFHMFKASQRLLVNPSRDSDFRPFAQKPFKLPLLIN